MFESSILSPVNAMATQSWSVVRSMGYWMVDNITGPLRESHMRTYLSYGSNCSSTQSF